MDFAERQAQAKESNKMMLDVEVKNKVAHRLYEYLNFQSIEVLTDPRYCKRFDYQGSILHGKISASVKEARFYSCRIQNMVNNNELKIKSRWFIMRYRTLVS